MISYQRCRSGRDQVGFDLRLRALTAVAVAVLGVGVAMAQGPPGPPVAADPFLSFELPDAWADEFWAAPGVEALLDLDPKDLAARVPVQAGFRHARCPTCDANEEDDPLGWSPEKPDIVTCRACKGEFPNEKIPAKTKDAKGKESVPAEVIEVLPGVRHSYPYHTVESTRQRYLDERLYLDAKRDYEAREFFAKAALYAALRHRKNPADPRPVRMAAVLLLRFAQVYPSYATHFDQPGQPKFLQPARLTPPFRRGYGTGKWDWQGCLDVPLNLVIAHALIRDGPALAEAGQALGEVDPIGTIERDLFRASAEFVRQQPEEYSESSLYAYRGLLAVGRLLGDAELVHEAVARLEGFAKRGFYFDGLWRHGNALAHNRVLDQIDGWIDRLLAGYSDAPGFLPPGGNRLENLPGAHFIPQLALAHEAGAAPLVDALPREVLRTSWPGPAERPGARRPALLGGAGLVRLAVGSDSDALDLELRGLGDFDASRSNRLALRLAVGGRTVLSDLDDHPPAPDGFDRATVSHNTATINSLNQRENPDLARLPAPGSDLRFFAADPDFQVAVLEDRFAYPTTATRYRRLLIVSAGVQTRYAVEVFDLEGGRQHDLFYHAAPGLLARWGLALSCVRGPGSLLPPGVVLVPGAQARDGRWFIQSYAAFTGLIQGLIDRPTTATLLGPESGVRLHLLGDLPATAYLGRSPAPTVAATADPGASDRAVLILRRQSPEPQATLATQFVTVYEPLSAAIEPLEQVGRVKSPPGTIVLLVRTGAGTEHLMVNLTPGTEQAVQLADGRELRTDGLVVRVRDSGLLLAGGTSATLGAERVEQSRATGTISRSYRIAQGPARGAFLCDGPMPDPATLAGRTLLVRHGDGTARGWTIDRVEPIGKAARIFVREEAGFQVEPETGEAVYYQFPRTRHPGPHQFVVAKLAR